MTLRLGVYGDSISTGWRGISHVNKRWTSIVCRNLGLEEHNFAVNGLGFLTKRDTDLFEKHPLEMVIDADPHIALIALGANDYPQLPENDDQLRRTMIEDMSRLRDSLPDSQVIVVEPYWPFLEEPPRIRRVFDLHAECAEETGLPFLLGQYGVFAADPTPFFYPEPDQIHPNDLGHARLAEVMTEALEPYVAKARAAG
jgi:lysophospholipase L1-like esterase